MDDETLLRQYILVDPLHAPPDAARVRGHDVAVWVLIRDLLAARGNVLAVAAAYALPLEAVLAARTYYLRHAAAFDARLRAARRASSETHRAA